jgi:hypothetical protein
MYCECASNYYMIQNKITMNVEVTQVGYELGVQHHASFTCVIS